MINSILTGWIVCSLALVDDYLQVRVVDVVDGNTLEVREKSGEQYIVVLYEVDAPEPGQSFGADAKQYVERALKGKKARLEITGKDRKGRPLVRVFIGKDKKIGSMLLVEGLAWVGEKCDEGKGLMEKARANKTGLWAENDPEPPWVYRRRKLMEEPKSL